MPDPFQIVTMVYMVPTVHERVTALGTITMEHATLIMEHVSANLDGLEIHALSKKQKRKIQVPILFAY